MADDSPDDFSDLSVFAPPPFPQIPPRAQAPFTNRQPSNVLAPAPSPAAPSPLQIKERTPPARQTVTKTTAPAPAAAPEQQTTQPPSWSPESFPESFGEQGTGPPPTANMPWEQAAPYIRRYESNDQNVMNYRAGEDPDLYTASGYYQLTNTNWKNIAPTQGIDIVKYPTAMSASPEDQEKVARALYEKEGFKPWAPYNPRLARAIHWQGPQMQTDYARAHQDAEQMEEESLRKLAARLDRVQADLEGAQRNYDEALRKGEPEQIALMQEKIAQERQNFANIEAAQERLARLEEEKARRLESDSDKLERWAQSTPTRQAVYANAMHTMPLLALLTAIGGAATGLHGMAMLGAVRGLVEGVNEGAENQYEDAMNRWKTTYDAFKQHMDNTQKVYDTYQDAYKDRLDGAKVAAEHAATVSGDKLSIEQLKITNALDSLKQKTTTANALVTHDIAWQKIEEARAARIAKMQSLAIDDPIVVATMGELLNRGMSPSKFGGRYMAATAIRGFFMDHPEMTPQQAAQTMIGSYNSQMAQEWVNRALGRRIGTGLTALVPLLQPNGGMLGELKDAATKFYNSLPGGGHTITDQIKSEIAQAIAGYRSQDGHGSWWENLGFYTSPEMQRYVAALEETRAELANAFARSGVRSDADNKRADAELPAYHGLDALLAAIAESQTMALKIINGDMTLLDTIRESGGTYSEVARSLGVLPYQSPAAAAQQEEMTGAPRIPPAGGPPTGGTGFRGGVRGPPLLQTPPPHQTPNASPDDPLGFR